MLSWLELEGTEELQRVMPVGDKLNVNALFSDEVGEFLRNNDPSIFRARELAREQPPPHWTPQELQEEQAEQEQEDIAEVTCPLCAEKFDTLRGALTHVRKNTK